jgi:hypothetical protein
MAINKNFVVKNGLEVNNGQIFADSASNRVGIGSTLPTVELDVQGAIAATDVVSSLLRVTGYSTLPQVTVSKNMVISGITTGAHLNVLGISSLSNLRVVGVSTFENNVNLDGNVNVTGFSTFVGLTSVAGNLKVAGFSTFSNYIQATGGVNVVGTVTATAFDGSFSGTGINIGIQSEGTTVSTATSTINFVPVNASVRVDASDGGSGITTVTLQSSGISLGLAIALGA